MTPDKRYWTLNGNNEPEGPYDWEQLKESAARGGITTDSHICPEGGNEWIPWSQILAQSTTKANEQTFSRGFLRWKRELIGGVIGLLAGLVIASILPLTTILHAGRYFRVYRPADKPPHAWFGSLRNSLTDQTTEIIVDFGRKLDFAKDDRLQGAFEPTDRTGVWNSTPYRVYTLKGEYSVLPPD